MRPMTVRPRLRNTRPETAGEGMRAGTGVPRGRRAGARTGLSRGRRAGAGTVLPRGRRAGAAAALGCTTLATVLTTVLATAGPATGSPGGRTTAQARATVTGARAGGATVTTAPAGRAALPSGTAPRLHVVGNKLVNASGTRVVLHGVDRSGTEYACVQGFGIFDGPNDQASVTAMKSWHINAVRVPLNEACWDAEPYVNPAYAGASYRAAIKAYVKLLNANGMVAIVDLHWSDGAYSGPSAGCSSWRAICQKPMPDSHALRFWTSVAHAFKGNDAVIFDLFNEPYPERAAGSSEARGWQCWLHGGNACPGISYQVVGMQSLVTAIRATGASNVIMLGGLEYSNDLTGWLSHEPSDPGHDLVASWHSYNFNACSTKTCWSSQVAPVIAKVPLIAGEIGENDCGHGYIDPLMSWLDAKSTSYLAWTWDDWSGACASGPTLITDYNGDPTGYGAGYRTHLRSLAAR
jgi:endoglucanase